MKLLLLSLLGCLVVCARSQGVKWCVVSDAEQRKCEALRVAAPAFSCVRKDTHLNCIKAVKRGDADAITLSAEDVYVSGLDTYGLRPIIAEEYGPTASDTCYYSVAVVKKTSSFTINDLKGKKSCHTGLGRYAGWKMAIGSLLSMGKIEWSGIEDGPLELAVADFFSASCVPGAAGMPGASKLCQLCSGDCSLTASEPYSGYSGAFKCLKDNAGEVAFVKHLIDIPASERGDYQLLCKDGTRASLDDYRRCHLAKKPAKAVVSRDDAAMADMIYTSLTSVPSSFNLFSSAAYSPSTNVMFSDSTRNLVRLSSTTDSFLYLGAEYTSTLRFLNKEPSSSAKANAIRWCSVGHAEKSKCDMWSITAENVDELGETPILCEMARTVDDCMKKIMRSEADAMAVDGGLVYTAGKCGLVPAMVEQYNPDLCSSNGGASSYYAVAVVRKGTVANWNGLKGKRSCHTGFGRTAGWNVPMGHVHRSLGHCDFSQFFPTGCAPGSDPSSSFCTNCKGSGAGVGDTDKCRATNHEQYYGYSGAFRCLVQGDGDVAFIKHSIVAELTGEGRPDWAASVNADDYELVCPDGASSGTAPLSGYAGCHLDLVPAHAVVTRPESRNQVVRILQEQEAMYGPSGSSSSFKMFTTDGKNLLFKDKTRCLQEVPAGGTYESFLGKGYVDTIKSLRECADDTPELEKACSFHSCQRKD